MSLLPTTRINSLVSTSSNIGAEPDLTGQDEDILLVDFQPVVVPNSQILSSPSTTTSTAMYPIPPPGLPLPGSHLVGINHQPSISSDGIATPISATGSSGKTHNPNNFSLVSLSNHVHHHSNNTSREESDLNYHSHHHPLPPSTTAANVVTQASISYDDENDEFAQHQALAQPSYMFNKRRSRRFTSRDNHMWDNTNHVGLHHQQSQALMSSSLSSSEDSDTGFLMGTRKTAYTRRSVQRVVDPHPTATVGGNASPSATTGLLPSIGNRKRVRRRRPSARNRKPVNNQRDKIPNPSDVLSFCCCLCDDEQPSHSNHRSSNSNSLRNRYFRVTCVIVIIVVIAVLASITVSLQRKVDSLDWNLKRLDQAVGSPLATDMANGASSHLTKPTESLESLITAHNDLNATVVSFKGQLEQAINKLQELQKQLSAAASKPDGVAEVRGDLAKLGSRVQEISATIKGVEDNVEKLKAQHVTEISGNPNQAGDKTQDTKPSPDAT